MPKKKYLEYETDTRGTEELIKIALTDTESEDALRAISLLRYRGDSEVFEAARKLCSSEDAQKRELGANILGQLGWDSPTFLEESVAVLIELLNDPVEDVIEAAAVALGHRNSSTAIPHLLRLKNHPDPDVRSGVVFGLSRHDNEMAVGGLIELSQDADEDVRDWATFGIGSLIELDTPEIREALVARLTEENPDIRGHALVGLAERSDERAVFPIIQELSGDHGALAVEAAEIMANPVFYPHLVSLRSRLESIDVAPRFIDAINDAIEACKPSDDTKVVQSNV